MSLEPFSLGACGCRASGLAGDCTFRIRLYKEEGWHGNSAMVVHMLDEDSPFQIYGENVFDQKISAFRHSGHWELRAPLNVGNNFIVRTHWLNTGGTNPPIHNTLVANSRFHIGLAMAKVGEPEGRNYLFLPQWRPDDFPAGPDGRPTGFLFQYPTPGALQYLPGPSGGDQFELRVTVPTHDYDPGNETFLPVEASQHPHNHLQVLCVKITIP